MNYCCHCASATHVATPENDHRERCVCSHCGAIHYQNPIPVVGCLATWENKVLLGRRAIEPRKGYWNVPAGFLELNESADLAAAREVHEETGAHVQITRLLTTITVLDSKQIHLFFTGPAKSSEIFTTAESDAVGWYREDEIPWDEIAFPSSELTLKKYFEDRKTHQERTHIMTAPSLHEWLQSR